LSPLVGGRHRHRWWCWAINPSSFKGVGARRPSFDEGGAGGQLLYLRGWALVVRRMKQSTKYLPMSNEIFKKIAAVENETLNEIFTDAQ
jgi:hypothetical protein